MKKEISAIIQMEIKDPRTQFVTVTKVQISRDLQHARIFYSVLGDETKFRRAQEGLESAQGFIRRLVGQRIKLRYTPEIVFVFDESIAYSAHLDQTIEQIKKDTAWQKKQKENQ